MAVVFQFNCQLPKQNVYKRSTRYFASYKIRTRRRSKYDCITILTFAIDKGKKRFQKCFGQEKINICTFVKLISLKTYFVYKLRIICGLNKSNQLETKQNGF